MYIFQPGPISCMHHTERQRQQCTNVPLYYKTEVIRYVTIINVSQLIIFVVNNLLYNDNILT